MVYKQIVVVFNPASSNAKRSLRRIKELINAFPKTRIHVINTVAEKDQNKKILQDNKNLLGSKTLLCIAAGDGTVSGVVQELVSNPNLNDEHRQSVILPLWGGNANDLAYMLNGFSPINRLRKLIKSGGKVAVYPLKISIVHEGVKDIKYATSYVSFGATGYAAYKLNSPKYRSKILYKVFLLRQFAELGVVVRAFIDAKKFKLKEDGNNSEVYEKIFVNGSRIAKFGKLPLKLTDREFYVATATYKHPKILLYALKVFRQRKPLGKIVQDATMEFVIDSPTWAQIDGEVFTIQPGSKINVTISSKHFLAHSTKLYQ